MLVIHLFCGGGDDDYDIMTRKKKKKKSGNVNQTKNKESFLSTNLRFYLFIY